MVAVVLMFLRYQFMIILTTCLPSILSCNQHSFHTTFQSCRCHIDDVKETLLSGVMSGLGGGVDCDTSQPGPFNNFLQAAELAGNTFAAEVINMEDATENNLYDLPQLSPLL
jgi:hypothetical protein